VNTVNIWRATQSLTACGIVCSSLLALGLWEKAPQIALHTTVILAGAVVSQLLLWRYRQTQPARLASWIYLANILLIVSITCLNHEFFVRTDITFAPFFGIKMTAAMIALQTPMERWVGITSLAVLLLAAPLQFFHWSPELRDHLGHMEPWLTTAIVICAGFIYMHRLRFFEMLQNEAKLEASAAELRRFTHLLLGAQHLSNTPLQVIEGTTQLIRDQFPETEHLVQKIEKAFIPIQNISQLMAFGNKHISWEDVELPTTVEELEKKVHQLSNDLTHYQTQLKLESSLDSRLDSRLDSGPNSRPPIERSDF
jgi:signal transduction histidine kinase